MLNTKSFESLITTGVKIKTVVNDLFKEGSPERKTFSIAAEISTLPKEATTEKLAREAIEENCAVAKDLLEAAIESLEADIAKLKKEPMKATPASDRIAGSVVLANYEKAFLLKPNFFGIGVDIPELVKLAIIKLKKKK